MRQITRSKPADLNWIQKKGLLAVKLAQIFALRPDIIGVKKCEELQLLYEQAATIPREDVNKIIREMALPEFHENVVEFNQEPLASASVGQVHLGKLKSGETVAIKVIKYDHKKSFKKDIKKMRRWLKLAIIFSPKLRKVGNPLALLSHVENYTLNELDLINEIRGAEQLIKIKDDLNDDFPLPLLKFPKYWENLSNENILVSEFIEGDTLRKRIDKQDITWEEMLQLFRIHGAYMFGVGTFHGDLHPGNCIIDNDGKFVFIDTSAICNAPKHVSKALFNFFNYLSASEKNNAYDALLKMSEKVTKDDREGYYSEMEKIYHDFEKRSVGEMSLTKIMMQTVKAAVIKAKADFGEDSFPIIRSLMYMDGMVVRTHPNKKLILEMGPYLKEFENIIEKEDDENGNSGI